MYIITHQDIAQLSIAPRQCYDWTEYILKNKNDMILPPKSSMKIGHGIFCNTMPCIVSMPDSKRYGCVKIVTRYPRRVPALESKLFLFDADSGETKAIMDANWITAMRTGAVAAHSVRLFAKNNYERIGIIGLGNTARATMLMLSEFSDREIKVGLLKYKEQENLFADRFSFCSDFKFEYFDDVKQLISQSDVVISAATYLPDDLCEDNVFGKGILIVPIHTLGFTNCDLFFDKVFADDTNHVSHFKYFDRYKSFAEVSDVINGEKSGRTSEDERIIVYNIGIALHDAYFAANIYEKLIGSKKLSSVDFEEPQTKFWL